jgi:signal transduction histidine kinase
MDIETTTAAQPVWHADRAMSPRRRGPRVLTELARRRTWGEFGYALIALPQGIFAFTYTVVTVSLSAGLLITFIGLPLLAASGVVMRWLGDGMRRGSNLVSDDEVAAPLPFRPRPGLVGWARSGITDATAWRARVYALLKLPLGILSFTVAITFYVTGLGGLSYPVWRPFLPYQHGDDGHRHRGANFGPHYFLDTPFRIVLMVVIGLVFLLAAPWVVRGVLLLDRAAVRGLLGPTRRDARVVELERTRATAVDDSAATLRRIERDLHDGAQARLVALAMNVGLAKEKLAEGGDPEQVQRLMDAAHITAKEAITELRDLARGIHPPVLDAGLDTALQTLVAHSAIPVELRAELTERPDPAIETMAYFCTAELLTNVAKHSRSPRARIDVWVDGGRLLVRVADDGVGGARIGAGSGLRGLAERVSTVDGKLVVSSPEGGPTTVLVDVPLRAGGRV